jgi:hypothetical protein
MKPHQQITLVAAPKLLILLLLTFLLFASTGCFALRRTANISGSVIDMQSGKPVPNAKVVLTTWYWGIWNSRPDNYGTVTDSNGHFSFFEKPGYGIDRFDLAALSPDNKYQHLSNFKGKRALLKLAPLSKKGENIGTSRYNTFNGAYTGGVKWRNTEQSVAGYPPQSVGSPEP